MEDVDLHKMCNFRPQHVYNSLKLSRQRWKLLSSSSDKLDARHCITTVYFMQSSWVLMQKPYVYSHYRLPAGLERNSSESETLRPSLSGWRRSKNGRVGNRHQRLLCLLLHLCNALILQMYFQFHSKHALESLTRRVPSSLRTAAVTGQRVACQAWSTVSQGEKMENSVSRRAGAFQ